MAAVWYIGASASRTVTPADWVAVGLTGREYTWDAGNGWAIDEDEFNAAQLAFLDRRSDFRVNAPNDSYVPQDPQVDRPPREWIDRAPILVSNGGVEIPQTSPSSSWYFPVPPGFNRRPAVAVFNSDGDQIFPGVMATPVYVAVSYPGPEVGSVVLT